MSDKSSVTGVPLIPTVACEHILELYGGRELPVKTREMRTEVLELHLSRGGHDPTRAISSVIEEALSHLKKNGHAQKRSHGLWIISNPESTNLVDNETDASNRDSENNGEERPPETKTAISGVYGFYFPDTKQLATLQGRERWLIKVGKSTDASSRVFSQTTGMHQIPKSFIIKATEEISLWESTLHDILSLAGKRSDESPGNEWFLTNPDELNRIVNAVESLL